MIAQAIAWAYPGATQPDDYVVTLRDGAEVLEEWRIDAPQPDAAALSQLVTDYQAYLDSDQSKEDSLYKTVDRDKVLRTLLRVLFSQQNDILQAKGLEPWTAAEFRQYLVGIYKTF